MLEIVDEVTTFTLAFKCGRRMPKRKQTEPAADPFVAAASKLVSVLKTYRKNRGLERKELLPLACSAIRHLSSVLKSSSGHRPKPTTIAVAIARLAGCGQSSAAVARQIDPALDHSGGWIDSIIDRGRRG